jgi:hypothetical protein
MSDNIRKSLEKNYRKQSENFDRLEESTEGAEWKRLLEDESKNSGCLHIVAILGTSIPVALFLGAKALYEMLA